MQNIGTWPRLQFPGQRLMHRLWSTIIFPKMLRLNYPFENSAEIYRILIFTHLYALLNRKSVLIPSLSYMLTQRLYINHQKCRLGRHPALGRRCNAKLLKKLIRTNQIETLFLILGFQKQIVSNRLEKIY